MVPHHGFRSVDAFPACGARAQPELRVVSVCQEILVESADLVQHALAIECRAAVGPKHLFLTIVLPAVECTAAPPAILAIRIDQMPHLVDALRVLPYEHLAGRHSDIGSLRAGTLE